jgi:hypothetical protein
MYSNFLQGKRTSSQKKKAHPPKVKKWGRREITPMNFRVIKSSHKGMAATRFQGQA